MKSNKIVIVLLALFVPATMFSQAPINRLQGLGETKYHETKYAPLDQTYHIFVRLPEEYDPKKKYPTAYLLDGGYTFPLLGSYYRSLNFSGETPELIIVGISYGSDDWGGVNQRSRDFTLPAQSNERYGGAPKFAQFFRSVLFPLIEENYASDPVKRMVFGNSLGGQFALYAAQFEKDLFWGHIASNPALHRNLERFIESGPEEGRQIRIYVSSGSRDSEQFLVPAKKWVQHWQEKKGIGWSLKCEILDGQTHMSATPEAFRRGLAWIFDIYESK